MTVTHITALSQWFGHIWHVNSDVVP